MQVNNVIDPFKYTEVPFGNKTELKDYLKVSWRFLECLRCLVLVAGCTFGVIEDRLHVYSSFIFQVVVQLVKYATIS